MCQLGIKGPEGFALFCAMVLFVLIALSRYPGKLNSNKQSVSESGNSNVARKVYCLSGLCEDNWWSEESSWSKEYDGTDWVRPCWYGNKYQEMYVTQYTAPFYFIESKKQCLLMPMKAGTKLKGILKESGLQVSCVTLIAINGDDPVVFVCYNVNHTRKENDDPVVSVFYNRTREENAKQPLVDVIVSSKDEPYGWPTFVQ